MSNAITRNTPSTTIRSVAKIEARRLRIQRWFSYNSKVIWICVGSALGVFVIVFGIWLFFNTKWHNENVALAQAAAMHHYKPNEAAWCDQSKDDVQADILGWIPCTVLQVNNKQYTQYFVTYGTAQADIPVTAMRVKAQ